MPIVLPVTLCSAAAASLLALWLMYRVGQARRAEKVFAGGGGSERLLRRMRARANFVESAPLVLILIAAIELTGRGAAWLPFVAALYFAGRVLHAPGMDAGAPLWLRVVGTAATMLTMFGLALAVIALLFGIA